MAFKLDEINRRLEAFKTKTIQAGILGGTYENGTNIAYVGAIQEYGAPDARIPPRPFMRSTVAARQGEWRRTLAANIARVAAGEMSADDLMNVVGARMAADIQTTIGEMDSPPLSPITVMLRGMRSHDRSLVVTGKTVGEAAQRVADGETNYGASDKPLTPPDSEGGTGLLLKSISWKVGE